MTLHPVILSGGCGTRLWPLSRDSYPKQFIPLLHGISPFQATVDRLQGLPEGRPIRIVANREHRFLVLDQLQTGAGAPPHTLYLEPFGRNTAPAAAIVAFDLLREDPDAVMLVLPADHDIPDAELFRRAVATGLRALPDTPLVAFGLEAHWPETGFGYIERGPALRAAPGCHEIASFVEKPEVEIARGLVASGRHYWNSGIFLFSAAALVTELRRLEPELAAACESAAAALHEEHGCRVIDEKTFARCRSVSIDHAVMERTSAAAMVCAGFPWSDVGSWHAVWDRTGKDAQGNVTHGDVHLLDVEDSYIHSTRRMVVGIGLRDMVVVETPDALLIAPRREAQHVKDMVEHLRSLQRVECRVPRRVYRPWGHYEDVDAGTRFRVKRITVHPGAKLSLQLHHHRAEHWVVVSGTARVTRGDEELMLSENQSTYIPIGVSHRLENPGKIPLEVIETQSGAYLEEDDIVRLQDVYHRV